MTSQQVGLSRKDTLLESSWKWTMVPSLTRSIDNYIGGFSLPIHDESKECTVSEIRGKS